MSDLPPEAPNVTIRHFCIRWRALRTCAAALRTAQSLLPSAAATPVGCALGRRAFSPTSACKTNERVSWEVETHPNATRCLIAGAVGYLQMRRDLLRPQLHQRGQSCQQRR